MLLEVDPVAVDVLANLDVRLPLDAADPDELKRWKTREYLRIAARDLTARDELEATVALIAAMARDVLRVASTLIEPGDALATIGMGKLGGRAELRATST
jgi:glutamine synthetase adenylyltransferase